MPALVLLAGLVCWNPAGNFWKTVEPPKAQCEAYDVERLHSSAELTPEIYDPQKLNRLIREPQNTVSNLAYVTVGFALLLAGRKPATIGLGLAGIFLGIGSGLYHATLLPEWRMIDILGVYATLYMLLAVGVSANFRRLDGKAIAWGLTLFMWLAAIHTGAHRNDIRWFGVKLFDSTYIFVVTVAAGCWLAVIAHRRAVVRRQYFLALAMLAISASLSFAGGIGDRFGGFWASPESLIQGHTIWHASGAVAILAAYEVFAATGFDRSTLGGFTHR